MHLGPLSATVRTAHIVKRAHNIHLRCRSAPNGAERAARHKSTHRHREPQHRRLQACNREQTRSPLDLDLPLHLISSGRYRLISSGRYRLDVHALFLDIEIALTEGPRRRRGVLIDERSVPWATLRFGRRGCGARTSYGVRITTLISGTQWQSVAHLLRGPAKLISGNPWHSMAISGAPPKGS